MPANPSKNTSVQPIPVRQATAPKRFRNKYAPKRVAPPPPKMKSRKKQGKVLNDSEHYAVPSPYIEPIPSQKAQVSPQTNESVYDIPKRQLLHMKRWGRKKSKNTEYKEIDVTKVQPPNPYAELTVKDKEAR